MRMPLFTLAIAALAVSLVGCSKQPDAGGGAANAAALADQLEAKADNLEMIADDSSNSEAATQMENASDALEQESANLRAAASPNGGVR